MEKKDIISMMEDKGLSDIEILKDEEGVLVVRAFYDFDEEELASAASFAKEEAEEESDEYYFDHMFPFLTDLAVDNIGDIVEEIIEDENIDGQFVTYDIDPEDYGTIEVILMFLKDDLDVDFETVLEELSL
ncbi:hypothetical protein [Youngiibacter fragilis]|uniref:Uncharacterized protein n=1 Tax=Youngiibacter fragilis 232.1 TaxID=994573 RepID=V7I1U6_9CLOT|nr:hypothetical protein [Youngiibacter fragilis]ETA79848.1 hypothetical protein T472_0215095 [Youngiibacter fragilis 232.1]